MACGVADVEDGDDAAVTVGVSDAPPALEEKDVTCAEETGIYSAAAGGEWNGDEGESGSV